VQAIIKLALEAPLELRIIQVAGMKLEVIRVHRNTWVFEFDDDFDCIACGPRREIEQRVLVEPELLENAVEPRITYLRHASIVMENGTKPQRTEEE
jgi:hypothetical protein